MLKYIHLILTFFVLVANLVVCIVIPGIRTPAVIASFAVIFVNGLAIHIIANLKIQDGYKISIPITLVCCGIVEYALSFFLKDVIQGSFAFLVIALLVLLEAAITITCIAISWHNQIN